MGYVRGSFLCAITLAGLLVLLSCGKKALPTPPETLAPPVVSDLTLQADGNMLKLTWSVPAWEPKNGDRLAGFRVYHSLEERSAPACEDCPRQYQLVAEVDMGKRVAGERIAYTEVMKQGFRYFYRVSCYTEDGVEGDKSKTVTISP